MVTTRSLEAYPHEFLEFYRKASTDEVRVKFLTTKDKSGYKKAVNTRYNMHAMRTVMKKVKHPLYSAAARVQIGILDDDGHSLDAKLMKDTREGLPHVWMVGRPRDSHVLGAFHDAGIKPTSISEAEKSSLTSLFNFEPEGDSE